VFVALLLLTGVANAGRKRIVVLDFEGDKAEQFHEDVVRLIKKTHTVVSLDKWNGTAEEMSATKPTAPNIKKVAKKLKIDGVVSGTVEKRRDEYIVRIKLRSGASGELVGSQVNIKSESAKLDGTAARDLKDELIEVIGTLESNRDGGGGGGDEEEEKPKKSGFGKKASDDEE
jgi:TolB-like protein